MITEPYRPVLASRPVRRVLAGIGISSVGDGLSTVAISWLALQLAPAGQQGIWVALAVASYNLPGAVGTFVLARWLRGRRGAQLAFSDAMLRTCALLLIPLAQVAGMLTVGLLVALLAGSSLLNSWGKSGRYVLIAELLPAEHRLAGNAVINVVLELAYVAGPPLAALLLTFAHPSMVIGVDALSFAAMALIYRYGLPKHVYRKRLSDGASRSAGFQAIRRSRDIAALIGVSFLFFLFFGPVAVALPVYVADELDASAGVLAGYFTAFGIGGFLGAFGAGHLRRWPVLWTSLVSVLGVGVFLLPLAAPMPAAVGWLSFGIAGLFWGPFPATTTAHFQATAPAADLASILAARSALQVFAMPAGTLLAGPLVAAVGGGSTLVLAGGLIVALAVTAAGIIAVTTCRGTPAADTTTGEEH